MNVKLDFVSGSEISSSLLPLVVLVQNSNQPSHRSLGFPCRLFWKRNYDYSNQFNLKVVKKSVKPVVKQKADEEQEKESMEAAPQMTENRGVVENKDLVTRSNSSSSSVGSKGRGSLSKESTPARGGGAARKPRKPRLAANFGGVLPPQ